MNVLQTILVPNLRFWDSIFSPLVVYDFSNFSIRWRCRGLRLMFFSLSLLGKWLIFVHHMQMVMAKVVVMVLYVLLSLSTFKKDKSFQSLLRLYLFSGLTFRLVVFISFALHMILLVLTTGNDCPACIHKWAPSVFILYLWYPVFFNQVGCVPFFIYFLLLWFSASFLTSNCPATSRSLSGYRIWDSFWKVRSCGLAGAAGWCSQDSRFSLFLCCLDSLPQEKGPPHPLIIPLRFSLQCSIEHQYYMVFQVFLCLPCSSP